MPELQLNTPSGKRLRISRKLMLLPPLLSTRLILRNSTRPTRRLLRMRLLDKESSMPMQLLLVPTTPEAKWKLLRRRLLPIERSGRMLEMPSKPPELPLVRVLRSQLMVPPRVRTTPLTCQSTTSVDQSQLMSERLEKSDTSNI